MSDYKNYKGGKLSQEFYYKTLSLATNTMDRKMLNESISQQKNRSHTGANSLNDSLTLSKDKINTHSQTQVSKESIRLPSRHGFSQTSIDNHKTGPILVQKKNSTGGEVSVSRTEHNSKKSHGKVMTSSLPIQETRTLSGKLRSSLEVSGLHGKSKMPEQLMIKEKRSSSTIFREGKKKDEGSHSGLNSHSAEIKRPKRSSDGVRPGVGVKRSTASQRPKTFPNVDNILRLTPQLPPFENAQTVVKEFAQIKGFSVNTHLGTVRNYNEDRVSILLNAQQR